MKKLISIILLSLAVSTSQAREPQRGYRGLFDLDFHYFHEKTPWYEKSDYAYLSFSTAHGYQFNPHLFVGAGLALGGDNMFPVYADLRSDWKFGIFTPYADVKLGYNLTDGGGVFFSPSIGYRFNWGRKVGLNLGVGLTVKGYKADIFEISNSPDGYTMYEKVGTRNSSRSYLTIRLGIDF